MGREFLNKDVLIKVVSCLFVFALYSIVFLGDETVKNFMGEDNLIENLGALYFLTASILYFASFFQSSGPDQDKNSSRSKKNYYYFFLRPYSFLVSERK